MKYKVGDKIRIRTWNEMEKEYGLNKDGDIEINKDEKCSSTFRNKKEQWILTRNTRVFTIKIINKFSKYYLIEEDMDIWSWTDDMIQCLAGEESYEPPLKRWEILDIRG